MCAMDVLEGFNWRHPNYDTVYRARIERLENIRKSPEILAQLKEFYKTHPVEFITDWGQTFDPRNVEIGLSATVPFLPLPKQAEFVNWLLARWQGREDGLTEKSRDMGISWLCVAFAVWMWLFYDGTVIGFGSRKEEYVDDSGDPKSLFWKARQFIELLPPEFRPAGWNTKKHAPFMSITNPENGSAIVGEAGDNIGRGNRTSIYFKDESAFYERAEKIDAALSQTSNCKIDISTVNGNGNPFYRKRHGGKVPVFTFHWRDDPRKDDAWYKKQCDTLDAVIVAQEIDIDYNASTSDSWLSGEAITAAQRTPVTQVEANGGWVIGVDAAHFGDDESIIHMRKGRLNLPQVTRQGIDGIQLAGVVEAECDNLADSVNDIHAIVIELDGPGVSCFDQLKRGKYAAKVHGVHTGARQSDGRNYNLRSKMWRNAKEYLESPPVSMPNEPDFKAQAASVKYKYKDGLLLMQSKKEYKSEFGKSPDKADAFVLTFAAPDYIPTKKKANRHGGGGSWMG